MSERNPQTVVIILAAGNSSRLGQRKQLIKFKDSTLLQHTIHMAEASKAEKVIVVLGAYAEELGKKIKLNGKSSAVVNPAWESDMSGSMQAGLLKARQWNPKQVLFLLCDQPFVNKELLDEMISKKQKHKTGIVAATYQDTVGVPVIFDNKYFNRLMELKGTEGAKNVIYENIKDLFSVDFPLGAIDIDTETDVRKLAQMIKAERPTKS